jgi:hypothetical protein
MVLAQNAPNALTRNVNPAGVRLTQRATEAMGGIA